MLVDDRAQAAGGLGDCGGHGRGLRTVPAAGSDEGCRQSAWGGEHVRGGRALGAQPAEVRRVRLVPGRLQDRTPPVGPAADIEDHAAAHPAVRADRPDLRRALTQRARRGHGRLPCCARPVPTSRDPTNRSLRRCVHARSSGVKPTAQGLARRCEHSGRLAEVRVQRRCPKPAKSSGWAVASWPGSAATRPKRAWGAVLCSGVRKAVAGFSSFRPAVRSGAGAGDAAADGGDLGRQCGGQIVPPRGGRLQGHAGGEACQLTTVAGLDQREAFRVTLDLQPLGEQLPGGRHPIHTAVRRTPRWRGRAAHLCAPAEIRLLSGIVLPRDFICQLSSRCDRLRKG